MPALQLQFVGKELDFFNAPLLPSSVASKTSRRRIPAYLLYGEAPEKLAGPMLHVETIEARSARHHWKIEPHLHQVLHQLIFVTHGRGVVLAEGERSQYRPPALILIPAGAVHGFEFEPGTTGHVISASDELVRELARRDPTILMLFRRPAVLELAKGALRSTDLSQGVRMVAREARRSDSGHQLALHGWIEVVLANVLRLTSGNTADPDARSGRRRQLVARFGELIERRFRLNHSIAQYAAALHVSESRLRSACLALSGQSPVQLIHARIMLEAKRQLHYTDNPVSEIAYGLGFDDPAYFTRFFSRRAGVSPRGFRSRIPDG